MAKRQALETQLSYQAFHDPLTGLANRRRFVDQAEAGIGRRERVGSLAALFVDLDDFKTVNDSLGHAAGDELLVAVAARIRDGLRTTDLAARLGGDEFGVLLFGIPDVAYATVVAERLLAGISAPLTIGATQVHVNASIGVAVDSASMQSVDDLLSDADVAMYQAKALGKGRHHVFDGNPHGRAADTMRSTDHRTVRRPAVRPPRLEPEVG